jgi:hypothetical protein
VHAVMVGVPGSVRVSRRGPSGRPGADQGGGPPHPWCRHHIAGGVFSPVLESPLREIGGEPESDPHGAAMAALPFALAPTQPTPKARSLSR